MLLKTGQCFTNELELNCPTIVACVTALPLGTAAVAGSTQVLGNDGMFHVIPPAAPATIQTLSLTGNIVTLSGGGGSITLQDNDTQDISIAGNVISLTNGGSVVLPTSSAPTPQVLSISGQVLVLSGGGGSVLLPDLDTQDLTLAGNVLSITNGGSVTLPAYATPTETTDGVSATLMVNPADLYARENIPAQTGLGLTLGGIPAPTPSQSNWGINILGETLHYMPGAGWKIVADRYHQTAGTPFTAGAAGAWLSGVPVVAPREGLAIISGYANVNTTDTVAAAATAIFKNGAQITQANMNSGAVSGSPAASANIGYEGSTDTPAVAQYVLPGDVFCIAGILTESPFTLGGWTQISYIN